jgi:DNA-binding CsgD family transcriptional regulator
VHVSPSKRGVLAVVHASSAADLAAKVGRPCYEAIYGRNSPCPRCPVMIGKKPSLNTTGAVPLPRGTNAFALLRIAGEIRGKVRVRAVHLEEATVAELVRAKIDHAAQAAGLSAREHQIVQLLFEGASIEEIGRRLRISKRTVRFHQVNLLRKLRLDSRLGLAQLVL